jgi:ubiquinone/menaquinone biosynthesis C-methylase UbiE
LKKILFKSENLSELIIKKQEIEINYWANSLYEKPNQNSTQNIINKIKDAEIYISCLNKYDSFLCKKIKVLEIGSGQGWASCIYKKLYPDTHVVTTDISKFAIASIPMWERIFEVKLNEYYACRSSNLLEETASVDIIFCFSSAHHFLTHRSVLREINRILKPGGSAFYFYEPTTPKFWYRFAYWRVNRKRPNVPEDVLIIKNLKKIAAELDLDLQIDYYPSTINRGLIESIYYLLLNIFPILQRLLPCTANIIIRKKLNQRIQS